MAKVKGDVSGKFTFKADRNEDEYFIMYVNKDHPKKPLDFVMSQISADRLSDMLLAMLLDGDSYMRAALGFFATKAVTQLTLKNANAQRMYEETKYNDEHNGKLTGEENNLSSNKS